MWETANRSRPALLAAFLVSAGCAVDLNERLLPCPDSARVDTIHAWASNVAVLPAAPYEWPEHLREPFREYGSPPVTFEELERRYGPPTRAWETDGRPFVEYLRPDGALRLGVEDDKSGAYVHRSRRLRWESRETELSLILEESVFACVADLLSADTDLTLLSRDSRSPRVLIRVRGGKAREVVWLNLDSTGKDADSLEKGRDEEEE